MWFVTVIRRDDALWSLYVFLFCLFTELLKKENLVVDSKVYIYAMGMSQAFFKPNELPVLKQWGMKSTNPPRL